MKTQVDIDSLLQAFEKRFGLQVRGAEQRSEAWFNMKFGVLSGSCAKEIVAKKGTATRSTYIAELVGQVCTTVADEFDFKQTNWGIEHEDAARSAYEFATGTKITPVSFVFKDDKFRAGCSPDGIESSGIPTEIKCPWDTTNYIKFLTGDAIKPEWEWQVQFNMWVLGADQYSVAMFDPRMKVKPFHRVVFERDADMQAKIEAAVPECVAEMDELLAKIGIEFGSHWLRLAEKAARAAESA